MAHSIRTISAHDGVSLSTELWSPEGPPRFVVVVSHGGGEHVGRYARLAGELNEGGGLVFGPDHRGLGRSGGPRGHVVAFEDYTRDLLQVMRDVASHEAVDVPATRVPWFLFGHSMGGLIALTYLLDHQGAVPLAGAIISSPLLGLTMKVGPVKLAVGKLAGALAPRLTLPAGIPADAICRDPAEVARYTADPLNVSVVSAGWFRAMNAAIARVEAGAQSITLPALWYVGTGDRICDHTATERVFAGLRQAPARDQQLRRFDGYYHELHNEPDDLRAPVIEMLRGWIDAHVDAAPSAR